MKKGKETKKKGGCLRNVGIAILALIVIGAIASIGDDEKSKDKPKETQEETKKQEEKKPEFTMMSDDTIGASNHTVVGMDNAEPSGEYEIVCVEGHGDLVVNESNLTVLAKDDYLGKDFSGKLYEEKVTMQLNGNDVIRIRNYNSSDFKVEFYLVEAGSEKQEEQAAEDQVPTEYKSALQKAQIYSDTMFMSKKAIYDQLVSEYGEKFSPEAAQYAIDNLQTDYNRNALEKARVYQNDMAMSPDAIRDQLTSENGEQFTAEEAEYAISNLN